MASAAPANQAVAPSGGSRTVTIVLGVALALLLLFVISISTAFHRVASKVRALAGGDAQTSRQGRTRAGATPVSSPSRAPPGPRVAHLSLPVRR